MRFGLVHRIMTDSLAALGVLAVVGAASMNHVTTAVVLVGLAAALAVPESWQSKNAIRQLATVGPLLLFAVQMVRFLAGHSAIDTAIEFATFLQIIRLATRRGAAHDQQIIVLALLHFVAGTVLGGGLSYALCFLGFLVVAPGALVLSHLRREVEGNYRQGARDRTGLPVDVPRILRSRRVVGRGFLATTCLLSVPLFLFTASLFILFPRVGLSLLLVHSPRPGRMIGFSDHVDLGEVGVLRSDPSIALRFDVPDLPEPRPPKLTLRLRGAAFDRYDGRAWSRSPRDRAAATGWTTLPLFRMPSPDDRKVTIDLEPIDPPVVFLPPRTVALSLRNQPRPINVEPTTMNRGAEGEVRYSGPESRGIHYDAFIADDRELLSEKLTPQERARYLDVPPDMPSRISALAHEWADAQPTAYLKAKEIERHLKQDFRYDTASPSQGQPQPIDHFLFESKRGHCEFFSTTLAVMLRDLGIPARNVTGFVGGNYNRFGNYYAVRQGDAHSWVEAYLDDPVNAWFTLDPTPTSGAQPLEETTGAYVYVRDLIEALSQRWNRYVVGYDLKTQLHLFEQFSRNYESIRAKTHTNRGVMERVTRPHVLAGALLLSSIVAYLIWQRRKRPGATKEATKTPTPDSKALLAVIDLYRSLETALALQGLGRPPAVPPLKHAEDLVAKAHPLAPEIFDLTNRYLEVRFGGAALSDDDARQFERRTKEIRAFRREPVKPTPAAAT